MSQISNNFVIVNDSQLIALIESAQKRVAFLGPGITIQVADAIVDKWASLGVDNIRIVLDTDPEVARLGYGTLEGLEKLHTAAQRLGTSIHIQPGLRIGLLVIDDNAIVYSPIPQLIEAGSTDDFQPNGLYLSQVPQGIIQEIGLCKFGDLGTSIGVVTATTEMINQVKKNIEENPPQKFDISRKVMVFNSRFEFVEFSVKGCSFSRKVVKIPSDLLGFIADQKVRDKFQGTYKLIQKESELLEILIYKRRKSIVDKWLITLPNYGMIVLRKNKERFIDDVEKLKNFVTDSQNEIENKLQQDITESVETLVKSLLPGVLKNPPARWMKYFGLAPTQDGIHNRLNFELTKAFGSPHDWVESMDVKVLFKSVTYETLTDPRFQHAVRIAIPTMNLIHDEYNAAPSLFSSSDQWR